jgi:hypothetical protein
MYNIVNEVIMDMKEACEYVVNSRVKRCSERLSEVRSSYGEIRSFTAKEWSGVVVRRKSVFRKGKTYAFRGLWNHYNVPIV